MTYLVKYWLDEKETETGHKVICLLRVYNVLGRWKYATTSDTSTVSLIGEFSAFLKTIKISTFSKSFSPGEIHLRVLVITQKNRFSAKE